MHRVEAIVVSWYSTPLLLRLVDNLRRKAAGEVGFTVVDNSGGRDPDLGRLRRLGGVRLLPFSPGAGGSHAHAGGLAHAVAASGSERVLVVDPDVHLFLDAWDRRLDEEMERCGAAVVGAPYPWWKLGKYHDFPAPVFLFAAPELLRRLGNDWSPFAASAWARGAHRLGRQVVRLGGWAGRRRLLASPRLARWARRLEALFGVCAPDTGYRLAAAARRRGLAVRLLPEVTPGEAAGRWGEGSAWVDLAREFELFRLAGRPALAHRYSTGTGLWRTPRGGDDAYWSERLARAEAEGAAAAGEGAS